MKKTEEMKNLGKKEAKDANEARRKAQQILLKTPIVRKPIIKNQDQK